MRSSVFGQDRGGMSKGLRLPALGKTPLSSARNCANMLMFGSLNSFRKIGKNKLDITFVWKAANMLDNYSVYPFSFMLLIIM